MSSTPPDELANCFGAAAPEQLLAPSYNVAPTNDVFTVLESGGVRRVEAMHWGLVPFWAKDPGAGNRMINARSETLTERNAYKHAYKKRRCIIPADGFYEWKAVPGQKRKQPMYIHSTDGAPLAFAGLWEVWRNKERPDDGDLHSCTIITGSPNEKVAEVHDRMPIMLPPDAWATWLDPELADVEILGKLLVPAPSTALDLHPVSTEVNNVRTKGADLIRRIEPETGELFG